MRAKVFGKIEGICANIEAKNWDNLSAIRDARQKVFTEVLDCILPALVAIEGKRDELDGLRYRARVILNESFTKAERVCEQREQLEEMEEAFEAINKIFE